MDSEREKQLRAWLAKPEAKSLATVLASKSRLLQERALQECFRASGENAYDLKSTASMKEAARYEICQDVLAELVERKEPFEIIKFKP